MNWLPWPLIPKRQWPAVRFKDKRAITLEEHQRIIAAKVNPERKTLYQLCWHLGASQGDIANLKGEDVDCLLDPHADNLPVRQTDPLSGAGRLVLRQVGALQIHHGGFLSSMITRTVFRRSSLRAL